MMPTKPLQVAFWSLLTGFVSILVLSTLQIDTRPMTIIAGNRTNGAIENSIASSETDRGVRPQPASDGIESPPPPDSSSLVSVGQSGMTSHEMTWTNTSHRHDHIVRDPDPAASPTDQHANAPNNDDEALIEIGTIVIPSLTSNRTSAAAQQSDQQIQQFAGRDQRIADLEQRLDRLQEKLDHLLTTQAEHQTVELESMTQLVDQLQKDREIHRLRQQLDELQREQRQLTSAAESNPPSTVDDARDHESAQTAQRDDASVTIEPPRVSVSPPKKEGWTAVAPFDHEEKPKSGNQIPATPQSPTSRHSGDVPLPRETVAGVPRATSPIVIPETTSENELEIPVPPPEDVDPRSFDVEDVPFRVNSGDLPNFKLPPESRETSNQPEIERQPQSRTEPPGGKRRNDRLHTTEERDYTAPPDTTTPHPAQSESTSSRTTVVPKHPASLANTNIEPSTIAHHRPSPRTSLIVDAVVFNVRMQNPQRAGIEWDRLRTDGGRMLVDFAPTTVRNIEETGLALGALQGDISTLQSRLAAIADVEIVSKQQLTLNEQNVEFIHLNSKAFASDADAS
ncbi:MAG: hypothetical protein O2955_18530, partial [Planctomycetota bacterium]|nr:hypothetical protein [Planctomycetota bacterium]